MTKYVFALAALIGLALTNPADAQFFSSFGRSTVIVNDNRGVFGARNNVLLVNRGGRQDVLLLQQNRGFFGRNNSTLLLNSGRGFGGGAQLIQVNQSRGLFGLFGSSNINIIR